MVVINNSSLAVRTAVATIYYIGETPTVFLLDLLSIYIDVQARAILLTVSLYYFIIKAALAAQRQDRYRETKREITEEDPPSLHNIIIWIQLTQLHKATNKRTTGGATCSL
ncbi:hypothetical protein ACJX0J_010946 [Zea mays]